MNSKSMLIMYGLWITIAFFPTYLFTSSNSIGQQFFFATYLLILIVVHFYLKTSGKLSTPKLECSVLFVVLALILSGFVFKVLHVELSDFVKHLRYGFYLLVFLFTYNICISIGFESKNAVWLISFFIVSCFVFLVIQLVCYQCVSIITPRSGFDFRGINLGGPFVWSYIFSFVVCPFVFYYLFLFSNEKRIVYFVFAVLVMFVVLLSQSKASYLAFVFTSLMFFMLMYKLNIQGRRFFSLLLFLAFVLMVFVIIANADKLTVFISFFETLSKGQVDPSTAGRIRQIGTLTHIFEDELILQFLFGISNEGIIIENAYFSYLQDYGMVGLFALLLFNCFLFYISIVYIVRALASKETHTIALALCFYCYVVSLFIYQLGASPLDANKSSYFFFSFWALVAYISRKNTIRRSNALFVEAKT
ncbi:hypothetical protein ACVBIL_18265 [Shewanella sp. 125m-7]